MHAGVSRPFAHNIMCVCVCVCVCVYASHRSESTEGGSSDSEGCVQKSLTGRIGPEKKSKHAYKVLSRYWTFVDDHRLCI